MVKYQRKLNTPIYTATTLLTTPPPHNPITTTQKPPWHQNPLTNKTLLLHPRDLSPSSPKWITSTQNPNYKNKPFPPPPRSSTSVTRSLTQTHTATTISDLCQSTLIPNLKSTPSSVTPIPNPKSTPKSKISDPHLDQPRSTPSSVMPKSTQIHNPHLTMSIHHLTYDTPIRANHPTLEQTHRSHIKPIGANSTEREEREREKSERERDEDRVERVGESELMREKRNKIMFLFLQLCYNAILHVELHCSTIANFFAIVCTYTIPYIWNLQSPVLMLLWSLLASIMQNSSFWGK